MVPVKTIRGAIWWIRTFCKFGGGVLGTKGRDWQFAEFADTPAGRIGDNGGTQSAGYQSLCAIIGQALETENQDGQSN
jgi:hypothetical protein